jgi:hypothetical protein
VAVAAAGGSTRNGCHAPHRRRIGPSPQSPSWAPASPLVPQPSDTKAKRYSSPSLMSTAAHGRKSRDLQRTRTRSQRVGYWTSGFVHEDPVSSRLA